VLKYDIQGATKGITMTHSQTNEIHDLGQGYSATMFPDGSMAVEGKDSFRVYLLPESVERLRKIFQAVEA
jgi:hypothetical protein